MAEYSEVVERAAAVLQHNSLPNGAIVPNRQNFDGVVFPWDLCTAAYGLADIDASAAARATEIYLDYQCSNGLIPSEVSFESDPKRLALQKLYYGTADLPYAIEAAAHSGITQPNLLPQTVLKIAEQLPAGEQLPYLKRMFRVCADFTYWELTHRQDPVDGLLVNLSPLEVGRDDDLAWNETQAAQYLKQSSGLGRLAISQAERAIGFVRRNYTDGRTLQLAHRADNRSVLLNFVLQNARLHFYDFDLQALRQASDAVLIKDVGYNAISAEANNALCSMVDLINDPAYRLPPSILLKMDRLARAIPNELWYEDPQQPHNSTYYSKNARTGQLIKTQTVASLFPLVLDLPADHVERLVDQFSRPELFGSTATSLPFNHLGHRGVYWRGAEWPMAELIINRGLERQGYHQEAYKQRDRDLNRISVLDMHETEAPLSMYHSGRGPTGFSAAAGKRIHYVFQQMAA